MKANEQDEMHNVHRAGCGCPEYYGDIHWLNGRTYCRKCIYDIWEKESIWRRTPGIDLVYPRYSDGVDYTKEDQTR